MTRQIQIRDYQYEAEKEMIKNFKKGITRQLISIPQAEEIL